MTDCQTDLERELDLLNAAVTGLLATLPLGCRAVLCRDAGLISPQVTELLSSLGQEFPRDVKGWKVSQRDDQARMLWEKLPPSIRHESVMVFGEDTGRLTDTPVETLSVVEATVTHLRNILSIRRQQQKLSPTGTVEN